MFCLKRARPALHNEPNLFAKTLLILAEQRAKLPADGRRPVVSRELLFTLRSIRPEAVAAFDRPRHFCYAFPETRQPSQSG